MIATACAPGGSHPPSTTAPAAPDDLGATAAVPALDGIRAIAGLEPGSIPAIAAAASGGIPAIAAAASGGIPAIVAAAPAGIPAIVAAQAANVSDCDAVSIATRSGACRAASMMESSSMVAVPMVGHRYGLLRLDAA
jgi:hypothetical protein